MLCLVSSSVEITQHGRHIEVKTPTVEMSCRLPLGCAIQGHGCHVRFRRIPVECDLSPSDITHDVFVGIDTMISEQTRRILSQSDNDRWQVRLGRTKLNLYTNEVQDVCACLDIIGQRYAKALCNASDLLETWEYAPATVRGRTGVQLFMVHAHTWHLMQRFAQEFYATEGDTIWHCLRNLHQGESFAIGKPGKPIQATIWAMPQQTYDSGDYIPLMYEYPDKQLSAHEDQSFATIGVWTAEQTEQWLANVLLPQVFCYYQVYRNSSFLTRKGLQYTIANVMAPDVFALYRERFGTHPQTFAGNVERRIPIGEITNQIDIIPYIDDLHEWFATYPVTRITAKQLYSYYSIIAEIVQESKPSLGALGALTKMFDKMEYALESGPGQSGGQLLHASFEMLLSHLTDQAKRINTIDYEYTACADLLSLALIHILGCRQQKVSDKLMISLREAIQPLWEQSRFDKRYVFP